MNRRLLWSALLLGLLLKWVGASWDVSSHFRTTQDSANPAHLINLAGNLLMVFMLFVHWRKRENTEQRPLLVFFGGMSVVGLAVPLDVAWHQIYGLDLTTWSPTHMLLFYGTAIATAGLSWLLLVHLGWRWTSAAIRPRLGALRYGLVAILLARVLAPLLFPASFNEFSVVAAENLEHGQSIYAVDSTLVAFAAHFHDLPYADLPHALYPAYTLATAAAFLILIRRMSRAPGLAIAVATAYVLGRLVPDIAMGLLDFPTSAVPFQVILIGLAVELAWMQTLEPHFRGALAGLTAIFLTYLFWALPSAWPPRVPLDWSSLLWVVPTTLLICVLSATLPGLPIRRLGLRLERLVPRWFTQHRPTAATEGVEPSS